MEGSQKLVRTASKDGKIGSSPSLFPENLCNSSGGESASLSSVDQSRVLVSRIPRQVVSLCTCSKLYVVCFIAGVFVGATLKQRVQRWASKLLKRLKDN